MHRIVFTGHVLATSDAVAARADAELAVRQCEANAITGLTLYCKGSFISALEGDAAFLKAILAFYQADTRMGEVKAIIDLPAAERDFPDYRIGFLREAFVPEVEAAFALTPQSLSWALGRGQDGEAKTLLRTFGMVNGVMPAPNVRVASGF